MNDEKKSSKIYIGVLASNYDETITKYDTFCSVIVQSCKNYYKNKPKTHDFSKLEKEVERILTTHINDRISWCNEWLPTSPMEKFDGNAIAKLFLAISEFEYIYNFKMEKEMEILQLLNQYIVDNSSISCKEGWEFREGAFETLQMLTNNSKKFLIVSVSKGSKRIKDTLINIVNNKECEFELITNEFEYKSTNGMVATAPNSLFGPSCKYRSFKQSVKEFSRNRNKKMREKFHNLLSSMSFNSVSKKDIYIKSVFFGNRANDLECILYAEIGILLIDSSDAESLCDIPTADYTLSSDQTCLSLPSNLDNSINMDTFTFKICELFSIYIVPISDNHSDKVRESGLKIYENVRRSDGIVDIRDYLRISRKMRYQNSKFSQFKFTGIILLAFSWDEIMRFFRTHLSSML